VWKVYFPEDRGNKEAPAEGREDWHFQLRNKGKTSLAKLVLKEKIRCEGENN
jgi:hypothetical protein